MKLPRARGWIDLFPYFFFSLSFVERKNVHQLPLCGLYIDVILIAFICSLIFSRFKRKKSKALLELFAIEQIDILASLL